MDNIKLNYDDVTIVPEALTDIDSRRKCNPYDENEMLPIVASCMSSVVSLDNYKSFNKAKVYTVIPRSYSLEKRRRLLFTSEDFHKYNFIAFSLAEAKDVFIRTENLYLSKDKPAKICIDLANGHMKDLLNTIKLIKEKYGNKVIIMTGNISNPETYRYYEEAGVDYVRCTIGTGNCCFIKGTQIIMADGTTESIDDINVGDYVNTPEGPHKVINTFQKEVHETIKINDKIECTPNHEFFVIEKSVYNPEMTDEEILKVGKYIKASDLNSDYLLVED